MTDPRRGLLISCVWAISLAVLAASPCFASDDSEFLRMLKNNADGRFCDDLNRMIKVSYTLDRSRLLNFAIWYQADCIFDTVKKNVKKYPDPDQAGGGFREFLDREIYRSLRGPSHGHPLDQGVYGEWTQTTANAIDAGAVQAFGSLSAMLATMTWYCYWSDDGSIVEGLQYLVSLGANPYQNPNVPGIKGSPRRIAQTRCPGLNVFG
jgi:hypothetical protein